MLRINPFLLSDFQRRNSCFTLNCPWIGSTQAGESICMFLNLSLYTIKSFAIQLQKNYGGKG